MIHDITILFDFDIGLDIIQIVQVFDPYFLYELMREHID